MHTNSKDKTNYFQSVLHIIKGNLGAGLLGMPLAFKHLGWAMAVILLPSLCIISGYCVHTLSRSSREIGKQSESTDLSYSVLTRRSFEIGPTWTRIFGETVGRLVDLALMLTQIGICCVYLVFVVDNVTSILATYQIAISKWAAFLAIFPVAIGLSCIRTLNRLAIASLIANLLQVVGLILIIEYLMREPTKMSFRNRVAFRPYNEMALGFGSVMFAFEGISVVLPVYNRIKVREQFGSFCGIINVSFVVILSLYFWIGLLGYLRFGDDIKDSITLNLPAEPLYDSVRAMFTCSILLTYPLQLYVPNELIWGWCKKNLIMSHARVCDVNIASDNKNAHKAPAAASIIGPLEMAAPEEDNDQNQKNLDGKSASGVVPALTLDATSLTPNEAPNTFTGILTSEKQQRAACVLSSPPANDTSRVIEMNQEEEASTGGSRGSSVNVSSDPLVDQSHGEEGIPVRYEYYSRTAVVLVTFALAVSVPHLNLLMDFVGSFSGVLLCLFVPALIHLASFWNRLTGIKKGLLIVLDSAIMVISVWIGITGSYYSVLSIAGL